MVLRHPGPLAKDVCRYRESRGDDRLIRAEVLARSPLGCVGEHGTNGRNRGTLQHRLCFVAHGFRSVVAGAALVARRTAAGLCRCGCAGDRAGRVENRQRIYIRPADAYLVSVRRVRLQAKSAREVKHF